MKNSKHIQKVFIVCIVILAASIRLWQLGKVPPSPDWDEAALGYNAYSILKTGKDEYGTFLPRVLRSFDDYKPPLYAYLAIPSVAVFGLTVWSVRLPSAIVGTLAVLGTFFLVRELFFNFSSRHSKPDTRNPTLALVSALLLALSPWHIQFSRIAFEANIAIGINIWVLYLFFKGLRDRGWLLVSALLFGLGLYAYHSERIFLPLLALTVAVLYRRELFIHRRSVAAAVVVGVLVVAPLAPVIFDHTSFMRLKGTGSLSDKTGLLANSARKLQEDLASGDRLGALLENRRIVYAKKLLEGYLTHYSFRWLFVTGDNDRHHAPDNALLYLVELPFLLLGMYVVFMKIGGRLGKLLGVWFLIAPLAASPTTEVPHAIRSIVFLPIFQIFTAVGIIAAISNIKYQISNIHIKYQKLLAYGVSVLTILFLILNISYYFHMYFGHQNGEFSKFWQYGYEQAVAYAKAHYEEYQKIVVSTKLEQPHMFFLFFLPYDPKKYLAEGGTASGGFAEANNKFDKFEFRPIRWDKEERDGTTLYIGTFKEIHGDLLAAIFNVDGTEAIRIAK